MRLVPNLGGLRSIIFLKITFLRCKVVVESRLMLLVIFYNEWIGVFSVAGLQNILKMHAGSLCLMFVSGSHSSEDALRGVLAAARLLWEGRRWWLWRRVRQRRR